MTHTPILKNLVILLSMSLLLSAVGCREKTDLSTLGNNITCYAAAYSKGVYKSDNGGISWYPLLEDQEDIYFFSKKLFTSPDPQRLYVTTTGGGIFFIDMEKGVLNSVNEFKDEDVRTVVFGEVSKGQMNDFEILVGKKETGINRGLEGEDNWEPFNNGLTYRDVNVLFQNAGDLFVGTINGVFRWDNASNMWLDTSEGIENKNIITLSADPDEKTIYAGAGAYQYSKGIFQSISSFYKSVDNGRTWEESGEGLPDGVLVFSIAVNPIKQERVYLGTSEGIYRSTNSGGKWSRMDDGIPDKFQALDIIIVHISDDKDLVYSAGANGVFMALDDKNLEWVSRSYGLEKTYISSILLQTEQ